MGGLRTVRYERIWDRVSSDSIDQLCEGLVTLLYIVLDAYISSTLRSNNLNREWHSRVGSYGSCIDAAQLIGSPMHLLSQSRFKLAYTTLARRIVYGEAFELVTSHDCNNLGLVGFVCVQFRCVYILIVRYLLRVACCAHRVFGVPEARRPHLPLCFGCELNRTFMTRCQILQWH
jgi:hypothetical protein